MEPIPFTYWNTIQKWVLITVFVIFTVLTGLNVAAGKQIFLGPENSGVSSGGMSWFAGTNGGGFTTLDSADPPAGGYDFTISNTVSGFENKADWRCPAFSLGPAAGGSRPITFSFAYKLAGPVAKKNNIRVQLRFFDARTNFVSEIVVRIGTHTADSQMTDYKMRTVENIIVPRKARTADIWIDANIFEPWVSGIARFGNFSVTAAPRSLMFKAGVTFGSLFGLGILIWLVFFFRTRPF